MTYSCRGLICETFVKWSGFHLKFHVQEGKKDIKVTIYLKRRAEKLSLVFIIKCLSKSKKPVAGDRAYVSCWCLLGKHQRGKQRCQDSDSTTVHNLLFWTRTFLLVSSSVMSRNELWCFVHGQGWKSEQKHTKKNFAEFHNHFFHWLCLNEASSYSHTCAMNVIRRRLFEGWITAIHRINRYPVDNC